jgi:mitochondrial inner membrane protease subunit 1
MFLGRPISESSDHLIKVVQLIGVLYCVKTYGFDFSTTWGASMEPLIKEGGNIVVVDKLSHRFTGLKKGDVVVSGVPTDGHLVLKRICGLPGDSVSVGVRTVTVPQGHVWLLGDNRSASLDSRKYGPVPIALVQGKVGAIVWPLSDVALLV